MRPPPDVGDLVAFAVEAERAGIDGVMVSEHIVLGPSADAAGLPANPRDYALPGNQDPATPWPSPVVLLSAIAAATEHLRLVAGAIISPLRHPLATAKDLATLDRLSRGRLVVLPTVSWHRDEYDALGVPFARRGDILDEQLAIWSRAWAGSPVAFDGRHYRYGSGFNPLGQPGDAALARLAAALTAAGRSPGELEYVGGTRGMFTGPDGLADLDQALAGIPAQLARGFRTICVKPSQFTDDPARIGDFCRELVTKVSALA